MQCKVVGLHPELVAGHPGVLRWALEVVHRMTNSYALGIKSWCFAFSCTVVTVGGQDEEYIVKYGLSPREFLRAKPRGTLEGSGKLKTTPKNKMFCLSY